MAASTMPSGTTPSSKNARLARQTRSGWNGRAMRLPVVGRGASDDCMALPSSRQMERLNRLELRQHETHSSALCSVNRGARRRRPWQLHTRGLPIEPLAVLRCPGNSQFRNATECNPCEIDRPAGWRWRCSICLDLSRHPSRSSVHNRQARYLCARRTQNAAPIGRLWSLKS